MRRDIKTSIGIVFGLPASLLVLASCIVTPPTIRTADLIPEQRSGGSSVELVFPLRIERFEDARSNRRTIGYQTGLSLGATVVDIVADGDITTVFETIVTRQLEQKGIQAGQSIFNLRGTIQRTSVGNLPLTDGYKGEVAVELTLSNSETRAQMWSGIYGGTAGGKDPQAALA